VAGGPSLSSLYNSHQLTVILPKSRDAAELNVYCPNPRYLRSQVRSTYFHPLYCDKYLHLPKPQFHQYLPPRYPFPDHPRIICLHYPILPCLTPHFWPPNSDGLDSTFSVIHGHYMQIKIYGFMVFSEDAAEIIDRHQFFILVYLGCRGEPSVATLPAVLG